MSLAFQFGRDASGLDRQHGAVTVALPNAVIWGSGRELWGAGTSRERRGAGLSLWQHGAELWGMGTTTIDAGFDAAAYRLYRDILRATRTTSLYRIWNFVPRINQADHELENYRAFCQGRHRAFAECFGDDSERRMSAASAVGTAGEALCAVFVAGDAPVRYVENPFQVPAYRYPERYGPRAPSFARASVVGAAGSIHLYVSGTSSIRGSESLHPGDVSAQLELALDNVDAVARAAGLEGLKVDSDGDRLFRLYLRHPEDWQAARRVLRRRLLRRDDRCSVIQADICRRELLVEIEAFVGTDDGVR